MPAHKTALYIKIFIFAIVASVILGYAYFRVYDLLQGPYITIETPQNGSTVDESFVTVQGVAKNIQNLYMNGNRIFIDEEGKLKEELLLSYGYNVIELRADDKFGRETTKVLELVYK